jgi:glycosyltransferase involved in cell wall biosynthesis
MNLLFVHQNFPGQFKYLAPALAQAGHQVQALAIEGAGLPQIPMLRYKIGRGSSREIHPLARDFETKLIRGDACAAAAVHLRKSGFTPDVIVTNPGWGESLFLKDVWPDARMLALLEFYYASRGLDVNFDAEFAIHDLGNDARVRVKNAHLLLALETMDWGITPTQFQQSVMPRAYRDRISVIFDGIDTELVRPDARATFDLPGRTLRAGDEVLTFINRNLEPYRGYHRFMRALPQIMRARPNAVVLVVGGDEVSYGAAAPPGSTWKQIFFDEVKGKLNESDLGRLHFLGRVSYANYLRVLQVSACHVYLTYPFVLGWSCIEAMSAGCLLVGSATAPVQEVVEHGRNGLLVDFFDADALAHTVVDALAHPQSFAHLRLAARETSVARYDLATCCLPRQLQLIDRLAAGLLQAGERL